MWTHQSIEYVTVSGEAWLASASEYPRSMRALWESRPWAPTVLPCGRTFDVVNLPGLFGRRVLDELWESGPGCGPVATHRGRILVFCQVGTAQRLRTLLVWEEWARGVPPVLCHGAGDAITVPPVQRMVDAPEGPNRWIVAPDSREPWLPGSSVLLWACVRAARGGSAPAVPAEPVEFPLPVIRPPARAPARTQARTPIPAGAAAPPHPADLHPADPQLVDPHPADLHLGDPHLADLHLVDLHVVDPHPNDPHAADLHPADPHPASRPQVDLRRAAPRLPST